MTELEYFNLLNGLAGILTAFLFWMAIIVAGGK